VHTLDGRQASARTQAWSAADVFCSLSDNIQETFGIAPIEAMAAGLPVVVSDWDGYKDTVRHGVDGFRVPTLMPSAGQGQDLALRHALELDNYDHYCGLTCALVAVDLRAATAAFVQLLGDPALRRRLGDAGRAHAQQARDWRHIMGAYEALWAQQAELRLAAAPKHPAPTPQDQPWPARMDPWHAFAAYPTQQLRADTPLALAAPDAEQAWARAQAWSALNMVSYAQPVMPTPAEIQQVLKAAEAAARPGSALVWGAQGGPAGFLPAAVLVQGIAPARRAQVFRGLMALVKWGLLRGPDAVQPAPHPDVED
jgi:starch synthase